MKSMTFVSFHRIYFFILSGSWNFSLRTWCSRMVGLKNLVFSVSTFPLEPSVLCFPHPRKYLATPGIELYLGKGVPKCSFFQKIILYECFPIPMAYIRHHAKFEASRTTSQGCSGITLFSIGTHKNRIVQNDKMAITFLFDLQMKN